MMKFSNNKLALHEKAITRLNGRYYLGTIIGEKRFSRLVLIEYDGDSIIIKRSVFGIYPYYGGI